ncbi:MAG: tetratricopeptide repeat protein [Asgard group archaeon]|nr:tetratricopeptide repeat protein [Asgard group archaeon]
MSIDKLHLALKKENLEEIRKLTDIVTIEIISIHRRIPDNTFTDIELSNFAILKKIEDYLTNKLEKTDLELRRTFGELLLARGIIFLKSNNYSDSLSYLENALVIFEKMNYEYGLAECYLSLGDVHIIQGFKENALVNYRKSLALFENIKFEHHKELFLITAVNHVAIWLGYASEIALSIEHFEKSLKLSQKIKHKELQAVALNGLGWNYQTRGELDIALDFLKKSLTLTLEVKKTEPTNMDMWTYQQMGGIYHLKSDTNKAIDFYEKSLAISIEVKSLYATSWNHYLLIDIYLQNKEIHEAKDHLEKFAKFTSTVSENLTVKMMYELAYGLVLFKAGDALEKKKAQNKFISVINSQIQFNKIKIQAMLYLCESLTDSLNKYDKPTKTEIATFTQLKSLLKELNEIAIYQSSQHIIIETSIIESKIARHEFNFDKALKLLNRAYNLAKQRGLISLIEEISSEYDELFKKGDTPFLILLFLIIKERSLTEISEFLSISKPATSKHMKLLTNLDLVVTSKEEKIRSINIKAKYYRLSSQAQKLLSPIELSLKEMLTLAKENHTTLSTKFDSLKFTLRLWKKFQELTIEYLNLIENQVIPNARGLTTTDILDMNQIEQKMITHEDFFRFSQFSINSEQYPKFLEYWHEFNKKIKTLTKNNEDKSKSNSQFMLTMSIPLNALLEIEKMIRKK